MPSLGTSLSYNFVAQLFGRLISFAINVYLLRVVDSDVIGIVNVRLTLLYNTILFLTREPMRKADILRTSTTQFVNLLWLSPIFAFLLSLVFLAIWSFFSSTSESLPPLVLFAFPGAALIESLVEPFAVLSLRYSLASHYAWSQCILISLQRVFVLVFLLLSRYDHLHIYAFAQISASIAYALFNVANFYKYSYEKHEDLRWALSFRDFFPKPSAGIDRDSLSALGTMFGHSILKQLLTDGSGYVMTFTDIVSLKGQAVFDTIEKLGSLVCRIILAPLEESCSAHFRNEIRADQKVYSDNLKQSFVEVLHIAGIVGLVVCAFGIPYSSIAVWLYGGNLLAKNQGAQLLSAYCIYIFVMAINGITEGFAMSTMSNIQLAKHGGFLSILSVVQLLLTLPIVSFVGAIGFIIVKCLDMGARILYGWRQSKNYFDSNLRVFEVLPNLSTVIYLVVSLCATLLSQLIFGNEQGLTHSLCHIGIGGVLFVRVVLHIAQEDHIIAKLLHKAQRSHAE